MHLPDWHHAARNLHLATEAQYVTAIGLFVFALGFWVVGVSRISEFEGVGLSPFRKRVLSVFHILGCTLFAFAFVLLAVNLDRAYDHLVGAVLVSALILLFPVHIYVNLLRRIELRRRMNLST